MIFTGYKHSGQKKFLASIFVASSFLTFVSNRFAMLHIIFISNKSQGIVSKVFYNFE